MKASIIFLLFICSLSAQATMILAPDVSQVPKLEEMNNPTDLGGPDPVRDAARVRKEVQDLDNIKIHSKLYDEVSQDYLCTDFGPNMKLEDVCKRWEPKKK